MHEQADSRFESPHTAVDCNSIPGDAPSCAKPRLNLTDRKTRREALRKQNRAKKEAEKELRRRQRQEGLEFAASASRSNRVSEFKTVEEESEARLDAVTSQARIIRSKLPILLARLARIEDPRSPRKLKHQKTVLMIYGILMFVYQVSSRREANQKMTRPIFVANLKFLFPDLDRLPHQDTLMRLLSRIEVEQIEQALIDLIKNLIRKKKLYRWLIGKQYPLAIDGTRKLQRNWLFNEQCLESDHKQGEEKSTTYYVYVLEASLAFQNGMTIPLMSEFLTFETQDAQNTKQDNELKAFKRLAARLKETFPRLPFLVLLDGLYPNGPLVEICRLNRWGFMIVLPDKSLPSVWEEYNGLRDLTPNQRHRQVWGGRRQDFQWVNGIEYFYDRDQKQVVHVVVCHESWEEVDRQARIVTKRKRWAWLSSEPLTWQNVNERCNLGARHRWGIETEFLVEKRKGYGYEHCFAYDWKAMKGYHYLMRLGRLFNILAEYSVQLARMARVMGFQGLMRLILGSIGEAVLDRAKVQAKLDLPFQLRLE